MARHASQRTVLDDTIVIGDASDGTLALTIPDGVSRSCTLAD